MDLGSTYGLAGALNGVASGLDMGMRMQDRRQSRQIQEQELALRRQEADQATAERADDRSWRRQQSDRQMSLDEASQRRQDADLGLRREDLSLRRAQEQRLSGAAEVQAKLDAAKLTDAQQQEFRAQLGTATMRIRHKPDGTARTFFDPLFPEDRAVLSKFTGHEVTNAGWWENEKDPENPHIVVWGVDPQDAGLSNGGPPAPKVIFQSDARSWFNYLKTGNPGGDGETSKRVPAETPEQERAANLASDRTRRAQEADETATGLIRKRNAIQQQMAQLKDNRENRDTRAGLQKQIDTLNLDIQLASGKRDAATAKRESADSGTLAAADGTDAIPAEQGPAPKATDAPPVQGAQKASDGNWYVQKNGKWFRVD